MKNEKALDAYIATIAEINAKLAALTEQTENHLGHSPEEINWGHVGTAKHVLEQLTEITEFLGCDK
jgi:hypothetical protein